MKKLILNYDDKKVYDKDGGIDCYDIYYYGYFLLEEDAIHSYEDIQKLLRWSSYRSSYPFMLHDGLLDYEKEKEIESIKKNIVGLDNHYEIYLDVPIKNGLVSLENARFKDKDGFITTLKQQQENVKYVQKIRQESVVGFMDCVKQFIKIFAFCSTDYFDSTHNNLTQLDRCMGINSIIHLASEIKCIMEKQYSSMKELIEGNYIKCYNDYQMYIFDFSSIQKLRINVSIDNLDLYVQNNDDVAKGLIWDILKMLFSDHLDMKYVKETEKYIDFEHKKVEKFVEEYNLPQIKHLRQWINDTEKSSKLFFGPINKG